MPYIYSCIVYVHIYQNIYLFIYLFIILTVWKIQDNFNIIMRLERHGTYMNLLYWK